MEKQLKDGELYERRFKFKEKRANSNFLFTIVLLFFCFISLRMYWTQNFGGVIVDGSSMVKTLQNGDKLVMKRVWDIDDVERGDIIVVDVSGYEEFKGSGDYLIKRMIAFPGEKVRCRKGVVSVCKKGESRFEILDEPYAYYFHQAGYTDFEYALGEDEIFFLGDNRNDSCDSRYNIFGGSRLDCLYKTSDIFGVVPDWAVKHRNILEKIFF
jgi:signal peptidase I